MTFLHSDDSSYVHLYFTVSTCDAGEFTCSVDAGDATPSDALATIDVTNRETCSTCTGRASRPKV